MKSFVISIFLLFLVAIFVGAVTTFDTEYHPVPAFLQQFKVSAARSNIGDKLGSNKRTPAEEANAEFWSKSAQEKLKQKTQHPLNFNKAKNVILFLGDGMGLSTIAAARMRQGQLKGKTGEEEALSFEKFPYSGLSKTYCVDSQVADSACSATAYLCGVKGNIATIGVNAKVNLNNCTESENPANHVPSIAAWAQNAGKATGIITTVTLTHASPSGAYAHTANRNWECDADILRFGGNNDPAQCTDIAQQLITQEPGRNFDLLLGGGMGKFLPYYLRDLHGNMGQRLDHRNLLATWQGMHPGGVLVHNRNSLLRLNVSKVSHILGLFESGYMDYNAVSNKQKQPTLAEMTEVAINFLSKKSDKGYFIFIEGAHIDEANHANLAGLATDETLEMAKAVQKARNMTDPNETLIVVTADHSHPLSIAGYPERGNKILGVNQHDTDKNGLKYATLNYAAGTKQYLDETGARVNIDGKFGDRLSIQYPSYIHINGGVHGGDDVGVYASGPYEHLFRGVMEQSFIPHAMAFASCIGKGKTMCDN